MQRVRLASVSDAPAKHPLRLYRVGALADLLGVSMVTVWRWTKAGILPPPTAIGGIRGWTEEVVRQITEQRDQDPVAMAKLRALNPTKKKVA